MGVGDSGGVSDNVILSCADRSRVMKDEHGNPLRGEPRSCIGGAGAAWGGGVGCVRLGLGVCLRRLLAAGAGLWDGRPWLGKGAGLARGGSGCHVLPLVAWRPELREMI